MRLLDGRPVQGAVEGPSAVTIGVFDGLHLGHRRLLERTRAAAAALGGEAIVVTFKEHPDALLRGRPPERLRSEEDRLADLAEAGADTVVRLVFDEALRAMEPAVFAREILVETLHCRRLILGFDAAICRDRTGTAAVFAALGRDLGFRVERVEPVLVDGAPVSSSRIREELRAGAVERAARLLGRPWSFAARVVRGDGRGRRLGFPTANVPLPELVLPAPGVYAVFAAWEGESAPAVCHLGPRPTFGEQGPGRAEVHVLEGEPDLLGRRLRIAFVRRLRGIRRFGGEEELARAIAADAAAARRFLAEHASDS